MDTNILSPKALFQKDVRYTIPEGNALMSGIKRINGIPFGMMFVM